MVRFMVHYCVAHHRACACVALNMQECVEATIDPYAEGHIAFQH